MSQMDSSMALMMAQNSLAQNAMQPPLPQDDPSLQSGPIQAAYKMRHASANSTMRPTPTTSTMPVAQQVRAAKRQPIPDAMFDQGSPWAATVKAYNASLSPQQQQPSATPQASFGNMTAGHQANGGWNTELIQGDQDQMVHFDANGDKTGSDTPQSAAQSDHQAALMQQLGKGRTPDQQAQIGAILKGGGTMSNVLGQLHEWDRMDMANKRPSNGGTTPHQQFTETKSQLDEAERQLTNLTHKASQFGQFDPKNLSPQEQQMHWNLGQNIIPQLNQKMYGHLNDGAAPAASPQQQQPAQQQQQQVNIPHPPKPGTTLSAEIAQQMLQAAGGNKDKARELAKSAGWSF